MVLPDAGSATGPNGSKTLFGFSGADMGSGCELQRKVEDKEGHLRFVDMRLRPTEFLDFTSLTVEEFQMLIPPFEAAFQAHMAVWCLDGTARTARRFSIYQTCPLAAPEDRLFFLLTYLKTY